MIKSGQRFKSIGKTILDTWTGREVIQAVIPADAKNRRLVEKAFMVQASFLQNLVAGFADDFEIKLFLEPLFNGSKSAGPASAWLKCVEQLRNSLDLSAFDLSKYSVLGGEQPRFASLFNPENGAQSAGSKHHELEKYCYDLREFASYALSLPGGKNLPAGALLKIHVQAADEIQTRILSNVFYRKLQGRENLLLFLKGNAAASMAALLGLKNFDHDTPWEILEKLTRAVKLSHFSAVYILVDHLDSREDEETVRCLLDFSGIRPLVAIVFNRPDLLEYDMELVEKPVNLLLPCCKNSSRNETDLNTDERRLLRLFKTAGGRLNSRQLEKPAAARHKKALAGLLKRGCLHRAGNQDVFVDKSWLDSIRLSVEEEREIALTAAEDLDSSVLKLKKALLESDPELLSEVLVEYPFLDRQTRAWLLERQLENPGETELLKILIDYAGRCSDLELLNGLLEKAGRLPESFRLLKYALLLKKKRKYLDLDRILDQLQGKLPVELEDEYFFLCFIRHEKRSEHLQADRYLQMIRGEYYQRASMLQYSDRLIYGGQFDAARKLLTDIRTYFKKNRCELEFLEAESQAAKLAREEGQLAFAESEYKRIFLQAEVKNFSIFSAYVCVDLGNLLLQSGLHLQAEAWYLKAEAVFLHEGDENGLHLVLSNLFDVRLIKGEWKKAEEALHEVTAYDRRLNLKASLAVDLYNSAYLKFLRLDFEGAAVVLDEALALFKAQQNQAAFNTANFLRAMIFGMRNRQAGLNEIEREFGSFNGRERTRSRKYFCLGSGSGVKQDASVYAPVSDSFSALAYRILRSGDRELLPGLAEKARELSQGSKNYFHFEYLFLYFLVQGKEINELTEREKKDFLEMCDFFLLNRRRLPAEFSRLKNRIESDYSNDVFGTARLAEASRDWSLPDDFFRSFKAELSREDQAGFFRLRIYHEREMLFDFYSDKSYEGISAEIMEQCGNAESGAVLWKLEHLKKKLRLRGKNLYLFPVTVVLRESFAKGLEGRLLVASEREIQRQSFFLERMKSLLRRYGRLFANYYETRYRINEKMAFLVGESEALVQLKRDIARIARVDFNVLICGESGSGKELVARAIHLLSSREKGPFITVNCAAIPENLLESELFGFRRGAFSGASENRHGLLAAADKGTLFLDEIADLPLPLQAKLLRVIQEREFRPLGENRSYSVDLRFLAASNRDLETAMKQGTFREDLYYRLCDIAVKVPPLRERMDDIPLLAGHFFRKYGFSFPDQLSEEIVLHELQTSCWPGNVRELEARVKRIITFFPDKPDNDVSPCSFSLHNARETFERRMLQKTLRETGGNRAMSARRLNISRPALYKLLKKHKLERS